MEKSQVKIQIFEFLVLLITITGLFLWSRSESKDDYRASMTLIEAIRQDIKDFHGRLCAIEERTKEKK